MAALLLRCWASPWQVGQQRTLVIVWHSRQLLDEQVRFCLHPAALAEYQEVFSDCVTMHRTLFFELGAKAIRRQHNIVNKRGAAFFPNQPSGDRDTGRYERIEGADSSHEDSKDGAEPPGPLTPFPHDFYLIAWLATPFRNA
jgi:hypothetical protein